MSSLSTFVNIHFSSLCRTNIITDQYHTTSVCFILLVPLFLLVNLLAFSFLVRVDLVIPVINHVGLQQKSWMTHHVHHHQIERTSPLSLYPLGCMPIFSLFTNLHVSTFISVVCMISSCQLSPFVMHLWQHHFPSAY